MLDIHMGHQGGAAEHERHHDALAMPREADDVPRDCSVDPVAVSRSPKREPTEEQREHWVGGPGQYRGETVLLAESAEQKRRPHE